MKEPWKNEPHRAAPLEPVAGRVPPSDLDAEAAVLSACMLDSQVIDSVREILEVRDMYADANKRILETVYALQDAKQDVDIVAVSGALRDKGRLDQIGGTPYLAQLADATPAVAHVEEHARRVKEKSRMRDMISEAQQIAAEGYGDVGPVEAWFEQCDKRINAAAGEGKSKEITHATYGESARQTYKIIAESARSGATMVGHPTGFDELDNHVGGLAAGDLWIIGGYPGIGKTSWVKQAAEHVAMQKKGKTRICTVFFSLEMKYNQLMMRALSRRSSIPFSNIKIGRLMPEQWDTLIQVAKAGSDVAMILDECRDLNPHRMRRLIRRHMAQLRANIRAASKGEEDGELGLIVVDYIQLMSGNNPSKNRAEELGTISKELKKIALEFKCAVIALSSLNRPDQKVRPKCPGMSALRESGALEFDADVIMMVHRDDAFKDKGEAHDHIADLAVVKGRNSGTSRHEVQFDGRFTAFYPLNHSRYQEQQGEFGGW